MEFESGGGIWRCTDIGTRIVTAIRVDRVEKASKDGDLIAKVVLSRSQAEAEGWFNGPPYAVAEMVFDEDALNGCEPID
ncbi:hypothetical protein AB6806_11000 [Bosea sp. RCC_152_1]|uniref:hypothetical protein n=1 Tax=Bosea sp. RCC_152_1 TaxID=3239228 RepID=UPI003523AE3E